MEEESTPVILERASRTSRGKRMTKLLDDEIEADEEFWGQEAFGEVAGDIEYEAEEEVVDEFDSDFDEDETILEEAAPEEEVERVKKKRLLPPGTKPIKKDKKKASTPKTNGLDGIEAAVAAAIQGPKDDEPVRIRPSHKAIEEGTEYFEDFDGEKTVRKSTRTAVVIRQAQREALRAAIEASAIKPVKKKREGEKRITQEDMLLEAAQTEILNRQNLERMLAREEEVKQKAIIHKAVYTGPQIRFYSGDGKNVLEFMGAVTEAQELFGQPKPCYKRPKVCAVTGLPAKYMDPLTGLPYATKEAFKMIRERLDKQDYTQRTPGKQLRSVRLVSGRRSVRRARKPTMDGHKLSYHGIEATALQSKFTLREEAHHLSEPETPPLDGSTIDLTQEGGPPELSVSSGLRSFYTSVGRPKESFFDSSGHSQLEDKEAIPSTVGDLRELPWVEIPPPKEGPSDEEYLLDDLTSLDFGPILAMQHGLMQESHRGHDLGIDDPIGMISSMDELPSSLEFCPADLVT